MDFGQLTLKQLQNGYRFVPEQDAYLCNACGAAFQNGQCYPLGERFFDAPHAAAEHVRTAHGGSLTMLMDADSKYSPLTPNQAQLLSLFAQGMTDAQVAKRMGITASTVRHQRFTFREKAKQARLYLALYELTLERVSAGENTLIPVPDTTPLVDDRFMITEKERAQIMKSVFESETPLRLRTFPPKAKKQIVILTRLAQVFEAGREYSEKQMNEILKPIYADYAILRRGLVDYGYMGRTSDGTRYWLL